MSQRRWPRIVTRTRSAPTPAEVGRAVSTPHGRANRIRPAIEATADRVHARLDPVHPRVPTWVGASFSDGSRGFYRTESAGAAFAVVRLIRATDSRAVYFVRRITPGGAR